MACDASETEEFPFGLQPGRPPDCCGFASTLQRTHVNVLVIGDGRFVSTIATSQRRVCSLCYTIPLVSPRLPNCPACHVGSGRARSVHARGDDDRWHQRRAGPKAGAWLIGASVGQQITQAHGHAGHQAAGKRHRLVGAGNPPPPGCARTAGTPGSSSRRCRCPRPASRSRALRGWPALSSWSALAGVEPGKSGAGIVECQTEQTQPASPRSLANGPSGPCSDFQPLPFVVNGTVRTN